MLLRWRVIRKASGPCRMASQGEAYARLALASTQIVSVRGCDHGLDTSSTARSSLNRSIWDDVKIDIFEGNAKQQWIDEKKGWCYLCNEPLGNSVGVHISDRDHVCLGLFVYMIAQYPRTWSYGRVLRTASKTLRLHASGDAWCQDHLHCTSDCARRAELTSLLITLALPPHGALHGSFSGENTTSIWASGERMYKVHMSRLITMMSPPMAPGVHTQFTHKCWGRSNLERIYDALCIAEIKQTFFGVPGKTTKDSRAYWMRLLFWDLMTALDNRPVGDVTALLLEETLRRLAFELTFHMSMYYMNRAHDFWANLQEEPSVQKLRELNSL